MVEINKDLLAPCGLYCGVCSILIAHKDNNQNFKEKLMKIYKPFVKSIDDIACTGCLSEGVVFPVCRVCAIKNCNKKKGYEGCHECDDFPCKFIDNFPVEVGKKVILRAIHHRKEFGTKNWVETEEKRYKCPDCGNALFRGAKRCNKCGISVDVD